MDETKDTFAPENGAQNSSEDNQSAPTGDTNENTAQAASETNSVSEEAAQTETETDSDSEAEAAENENGSANEAATQFEFGAADSAPEAVNASKKKKVVLNTSIIAAIIIVAAAALSLLVVKCFFDNSIVGTWVQHEESESSEATSDEASSDEADTVDVYYVFNDDKTFECIVGTLKQFGTYSVDTDSTTGEQTVTLTTSTSSSELYYSVSGNVFTGKTLLLSSESLSSTDSTSTSSSTVYDLKSASLPNIELKVEDGFTPNDNITGTWTYDNGYYQMSYTFNADGTAVIAQALSGDSDMLRADGTYTYTDDTIIIKYYYSEEVEMDVAYEVTDDGLSLNELIYTKDTGEDSTTAADTTAAE